jgi:surface antigen
MSLSQSFLALAVVSLAACTSTQSNVAGGALAPPKSVQVTVKPDASGDARIRSALEAGLLQRGLKGGGKPVIAEFEDTWHWDLVMYLRFLNVRFVDPDSGAAFGSVRWKQKGLHVYPSQESAVADILKVLDDGGAFQK